jgi:hypothetical protein
MGPNRAPPGLERRGGRGGPVFSFSICLRLGPPGTCYRALMKWSRVALCAVLMAVLTLVVVRALTLGSPFLWARSLRGLISAQWLYGI